MEFKVPLNFQQTQPQRKLEKEGMKGKREVTTTYLGNRQVKEIPKNKDTLHLPQPFHEITNQGSPTYLTSTKTKPFEPFSLSEDSSDIIKSLSEETKSEEITNQSNININQPEVTRLNQTKNLANRLNDNDPSIRTKAVGIGVTGSLFVEEKVNDKWVKKAIIKSMDPPPDSFKRGLEKGLKSAGGQDRPTDNLVGEAKEQPRMKMLGESLCYSLAEHLGINDLAGTLVPETSCIPYSNEPHSMQVFEHGTMDAKTAFESTDTLKKELKSLRKNEPGATEKINNLENKIASIDAFQDNLKKLNKLTKEELKECDNWSDEKFKEKTGFTKDSIKKFQTFALFDFLTGNMDRHDENWLIKLTPNGQIDKIVAIDNGNSFPERHLRGGRSEFIKRNQYAWASLALSKVPPLSDVKNKFNSLELNYEKIEESIIRGVAENAEQIHDSGKGVLNTELEQLLTKFYTNEGMNKCLKDRIAILNLFVDNNLPPAELSNFKYKREFIDFSEGKNPVNKLIKQK